MVEDRWEALAGPFVDGAYATVKGQVRTYVLHQQLLRHLPPPPGSVLDVGGGAGHQSLPLARLGYDVTVLDPSTAMLAKAEERVAQEPDDVRSRVRLVRRQASPRSRPPMAAVLRVLCHGVLMFLPAPEPLSRSCADVSNPEDGLDHGAQRQDDGHAVGARAPVADALARSTPPARSVSSARPPAATPSNTSRRCCAVTVEPRAWYGVWLFSDWMDLPVADTDVEAWRRWSPGQPARPLPAAQPGLPPRRDRRFLADGGLLPCTRRTGQQVVHSADRIDAGPRVFLRCGSMKARTRFRWSS